jgi:hypothetical protein
MCGGVRRFFVCRPLAVFAFDHRQIKNPLAGHPKWGRSLVGNAISPPRRRHFQTKWSNGVPRRTLNGMKALNPRCFGVRDGFIGKKPEAQKPNRVPAKCAINAKCALISCVDMPGPVDIDTRQLLPIYKHA